MQPATKKDHLVSMCRSDECIASKCEGRHAPSLAFRFGSPYPVSPPSCCERPVVRKVGSDVDAIVNADADADAAATAALVPCCLAPPLAIVNGTSSRTVAPAPAPSSGNDSKANSSAFSLQAAAENPFPIFPEMTRQRSFSYSSIAARSFWTYGGESVSRLNCSHVDETYSRAAAAVTASLEH